MNLGKGTVLVSTLHDPSGRILNGIKGSVGKAVLKYFDSWRIVATIGTMGIEDDISLHRGNLKISQEKPGILVKDKIRNSHLQALKHGLDSQAGVIFYADADRVTADMVAHNESLNIIKLASERVPDKFGVISFIRHPGGENLPRRITEGIVNELLEKHAGCKLDPFSSYMAFTQTEAQKIVASCVQDKDREVSFPALEWTLEALKSNGTVAGVHLWSTPIGRFEDLFETKPGLDGSVMKYIDEAIKKEGGGIKGLFRVMKGPKGDVFQSYMDGALLPEQTAQVFQESYQEINHNPGEWRKRLMIATQAVADICANDPKVDGSPTLEKLNKIKLLTQGEGGIDETKLEKIMNIEASFNFPIEPEVRLPGTEGVFSPASENRAFQLTGFRKGVEREY